MSIAHCQNETGSKISKGEIQTRILACMPKGESMTLEEKVKKQLTSLGMSDEQAQGVIDLSKTKEPLEYFKNKWDLRVDEDIKGWLDILWIYIETVALEWIELNAPDAWFKPLFSLEENNV
jgi:hypothetical protein